MPAHDAASPPVQLHTTVLGEDGPPLVFLHGLFGQGRNWTAIGKELAETHRVTLVDLPNHGRSSWTSGLDLVADADRVADLLRTGPPAVLVGHSMGGKVAMLTALRHPELVERLCVVDIAPVEYRHVSGEFAGFIDAMLDLDLDRVERRSDADEALAPAVPDPSVRAFLLQNLRRDGDSWRWQVNLELLQAELAVVGGWPADRLAGLEPYDRPVLWLAGANSGYVRDRYAADMELLFPKVRRVTIKDSGHWVHSEQPEVFLEVLRRFVGPALTVS